MFSFILKGCYFFIEHVSCVIACVKSQPTSDAGQLAPQNVTSRSPLPLLILIPLLFAFGIHLFVVCFWFLVPNPFGC